MKLLFLSPILITLLCTATPWQEMQRLYHECMVNNSDSGLLDKWCHPQWIVTRNVLSEFIQRGNSKNFLLLPCVGGTMVRQGWSSCQAYEETYLEKCISDKTKCVLERVEDTRFGELERTSKKFACSTNTLGHLYYLARIIESSSLQRNPIKKIIEVGGGYGNFARLTKLAYPESTLIIIDIPEMSALQWYFLKKTLKTAQIYFHTKNDSLIVEGAINIVPLSCMDIIKDDIDCFVSTFALTEASRNFQEYIEKKNFFNASLCYITGQLDGWGNVFNFVPHGALFESIRTLYSSVLCQPFHIFENKIQSYELLAVR